MCELFGLCCNEKDRASRSLPIFGKKYSDANREGWGIAYYENHRAVLKKEPKKAKISKSFFETIEKAKSNIIIAHLRNPTRGAVCEKNCHPFKQSFQNKDWIFAHNGDMGDIPLHPRSLGDTDSEQVFNLLLDHIRSYQASGTIRGVYPGLIRGIKKVFREFGDGVLNFLMSDGSGLYAFNHYPEKPLYFLRKEKEYGGSSGDILSI